MVRPVALCELHRMQVALLVVPDALTMLVRQAKTGLNRLSLPADERAAVIAGARPKAAGAYMGGVHGPVVYFMENGDRIKIGHSTNLRSRVRALSLQDKDVLLLLQGGLTLERALHSTFAKERIDATEWFMKSERLISFIESKTGQLADLDVGSRRKQQRTVAPAVFLKKVVSHGPSRGSSSECAELAAPLYRQYLADNKGSKPSASALVGLLRDAHPGLRIPDSERSERNIRAAVERMLAAQSPGDAV